MTVQYVEKVYNFYAHIYDAVFGPVFRSGMERAPELLGLSPGMDLLEVGVGTGLSLNVLPRDIQMTGIDLSQKMLDQAAKRIGALGLEHVKLMKMDATRMDLADNSFDRVLAAYFISVVPDPVSVVKEMKRVCRPGGRLLFLNHFHHENPVVGLVEKIFSPLCYRIGFNSDLNLHKLMKDCGLEIEALERIDGFGYWKAVRCVNPAKD